MNRDGEEDEFGLGREVQMGTLDDLDDDVLENELILGNEGQSHKRTTSPSTLVVKNISVFMWFFAFLSLVVLCFDNAYSFREKDSYSVGQYTMFPSCLVLYCSMAGVLYTHLLSGYYSGRVWIKYEPLTYFVLSLYSGILFCFGVSSHCEGSECDSQMSTNQTINLVVNVAVFALVYVFAYYLPCTETYFARAGYAGHRGGDRSIEGVWLFEQSHILVYGLVFSIIFFSIAQIVSVSNLFLVFVAFLSLMLFMYILLYIRPPNPVLREQTKKNLTLSGRLEWACFCAFYVSFNLFMMIPSQFDVILGIGAPLYVCYDIFMWSRSRQGTPTNSEDNV